MVIAGNPGVRANGPAGIINNEIANSISRDSFIITFCGGGSETAEQIELLLKCLKETSGNWMLVPRYHPSVKNFIDPQTSRPYHEIWDEMLNPLGDRVVRFDNLNTEEVVGGSSVVTAGFSTLLTTSAVNGISTVVFGTPQTMAMIEEETGLKEIPQVKLGLATLATEPVDLFYIDPPSVEARKKVIPFDPGLVVEGIESYFLENM